MVGNQEPIRGGGLPGCTPPISKYKKKTHFDFVETVITNVPRDLLLGRNQTLVSVGD